MGNIQSKDKLISDKKETINPKQMLALGLLFPLINELTLNRLIPAYIRFGGLDQSSSDTIKKDATIGHLTSVKKSFVSVLFARRYPLPQTVLSISGS